MTATTEFDAQLAAGERFGFGENWARFLAHLDEARIAEAERSLTAMLGEGAVAGRRVLDVGCGSGLFSLAAMRLGAAAVHSIDLDPASVGCAQELRRRFFPGDGRWTAERASVLDAAQMAGLGTWDLVYSWGVLHHTGQLWTALDHAAARVAPGGRLFVAIYNDQGWRSRWWLHVKQLYNRGPLGKAAVCAVYLPYWTVGGAAKDLLRGIDPRRRYAEYKQARGMSRVHDWHDWLGGLPFEVATPEQVFDFCRARGFTLERLKTCGGGLGCNEFVLRRTERT